MNTQLKRSALLLGLFTVVSAHFAFPAAADSTADLILTLKCPNDYIVNVWKRYGSGELLYRGTGLLGDLSLANVCPEEVLLRRNLYDRHRAN